MPVHSADIMPWLISRPASASRRRISVDFQMPTCAARIRRFQRIAHPTVSPSRIAMRVFAAAQAFSTCSAGTCNGGVGYRNCLNALFVVILGGG